MFEKIEVDWKRVKRNMKIGLATFAVGLFILPSFLFGVLVFVGTLANLQEYTHSLFEWVLAALGIGIIALVIGVWFTEFVRGALLSRPIFRDKLSSKED